MLRSDILSSIYDHLHLNKNVNSERRMKMNTNYYEPNFNGYRSDERIFPGIGFGGPGFGVGSPFGFGFPFLTGLAAGALLTPRPPYYYSYPPYPYSAYPYPYHCCY